MKKTLIIGFLATGLLSSGAFAADIPIYGWDIKCLGKNDLVVTAKQSDDDFYISYAKGKSDAVEGYADATEQSNLKFKQILLRTVEMPGMKDPNIALFLERESLDPETFASGIVSIDDETHELNCYVRAGLDEEDFDSVSTSPFPDLKAPN